MYREIKKRRLILENRLPYALEASQYIEELGILDFIRTNLILEGSAITREEALAIAKGEILEHVALADHAMIARYKEGVREMGRMNSLKTELTLSSFLHLYDALFEPASLEYRKCNPVLRMIDYNPPHFYDVEEQVQKVIRWLHQEAPLQNPMEKAARLHNLLVEVCPFGEDSFVMARAAAQYYLICRGYPVIFWEIREQEYYDALRLYLKKKEAGPIYQVLLHGVYNKLEVMMQLTAEG